MPRRFRVRVAYDGTAYHGFQRQGKGEATIQEELEDALGRLTKTRATVVGAGRTDAGVHAVDQVCHFTVDTSIPEDRMCLALNSQLPRDIVAWHAEEVDGGFHAQHDATGKRYRYRLWVAQFVSPFWRRYTFHYYDPLDLDAMQAAARCLVGKHDFASFRAAGSDTEGTERTLRRLEVEQHGPIVDLVFEGDGFLYKMVRIVVGTLLEVGVGRQPISWTEEVLRACNRDVAGVTAPAQGLFLERVYYPGEDGEPPGWRPAATLFT